MGGGGGGVMEGEDVPFRVLCIDFFPYLFCRRFSFQRYSQ